jgi:hypothetical protein
MFPQLSEGNFLGDATNEEGTVARQPSRGHISGICCIQKIEDRRSALSKNNIQTLVREREIWETYISI